MVGGLIFLVGFRYFRQQKSSGAASLLAPNG
jgi:hypothetical protein